MSIQQLSQAHLQVLSTCPRQFQYWFLDNLALPALSSASEQQLGQQFHELVQQQALGLNVQPLLNRHPQLAEWLQRFQQYPPPQIEGDRHNEVQRHLRWQDFVLVAIYDRLILGRDRAQIIDWKTYTAATPEQLQQRWQSRLYPFILAETSPYPPEAITMTYWFAAGKTHHLSLPYSAERHAETRHTLNTLLHNLQEWEADRPLPQVPLGSSQCWSPQHQCPFLHYCQRHPDQRDPLLDWTQLATIAEQPL